MTLPHAILPGSRSESRAKQQSVANVIEIIPLGGIGEFGMNCTVLWFGHELPGARSAARYQQPHSTSRPR